MSALSVVLVAGVLEAGLGEPPERVHPVAWFGRLCSVFEGSWSRPRLVGTGLAVLAPLLGAVIVTVAVVVAGQIHPWVGTVLAGVGLFSVTSLRLLLSSARTVVRTSETAPERARTEVGRLVGRDVSDLSPAEVRSAAVESAAENLADGLVGPLFGFVVTVLLAGPVPVGQTVAFATGVAAWVKGVNTLDSMFGYRSNPVGWAPARLDDAVMWVPARLSALILAVSAGRPGAVLTVPAWLDSVRSPNAGWPMGTLAATAGLRLEKPGHYVLNPACRLPGVESADAAIRTVGMAGVGAYVLAVLAVTLREGVPWV